MCSVTRLATVFAPPLMLQLGFDPTTSRFEPESWTWFYTILLLCPCPITITLGMGYYKPPWRGKCVLQ